MLTHSTFLCDLYSNKNATSSQTEATTNWLHPSGFVEEQFRSAPTSERSQTSAKGRIKQSNSSQNLLVSENTFRHLWQVSILLFSINALSFAQVAVGDQRGTLQLVSIKKGEPFVDFKVDLKSPVNCVTILVSNNGIHKWLLLLFWYLLTRT